MKKILIILLFIPLVVFSQKPIPIGSPYIFNKYVKFNDSTIFKYVELVNGALPTVTKPSIAARNDTIFIFDGSNWIPVNGITAGYGIISDANVRVDTSKIATNRAVYDSIQYNLYGKLNYKGAYNASTNLWPSGTIVKGDWWTISVGGTLGSVTVTTDNQIYALVNAPGQTDANWDIVGLTQTIPIAKIAGAVGNGFVPYYGRNNTTKGVWTGIAKYANDSALRFNGGLVGSGTTVGLIGNAISGAGINASSTSYYSGYFTSITGGGIYINQTSGNTSPLIKGDINSVEKFNINSNGKGTFNGGVDVGTSMAQGRYIRANYTDADNGVLGNISATLQLNNSTNGIGKSTNALNYIADKQHRIILRQNPASTRTDTLLSLYTSYYTNQLKTYVDTFGYIHNNPPHYKGYFSDSSVVISLTQNTWYQITNQTYKTTWPTTDLHGFTDSGDTAIVSTGSAGHYLFIWEINITGSDSKTFEYRILRKRSGTTTTQWQFKVTGTGTDVLRHIQSYVEVQAGDRVWVEIRSTSSAPGNVTILGGQWYSHSIHL